MSISEQDAQRSCSVADLGKHSKVYISFGGLLMCLDGPYKKLSPLKIEYVYMLLKK